MTLLDVKNVLHEYYFEHNPFDPTYAGAGTTNAQQSFLNEACGLINDVSIKNHLESVIDCRSKMFEQLKGSVSCEDKTL